MSDQQNNQNTVPNQFPQQPQPQGYYIVNMSTAPYSAYPTMANTQIPVYSTEPQNYPPQMPNPQQQQQQIPQSYYVPQPQYYYDPASANTATPVVYDPVPLLAGGHVKDRLKMREYEVNVNGWLHESWNLYKEHWLSLVLFTMLFIAVQFIPYVGSFVALPLAPGFYIAATHHIRGNQWSSSHLFHGIYLFFPTLALGILYSLLVTVGLFLCIIPGLYFMVAYSLSLMIYIEYRQEGLGLIDSMNVSRHVVSKNFWEITGFLLAQLLIVIVGCLAFGIGFFIGYPVASMMSAFAIRDIVGLSAKRTEDRSCVCC